MPILRQKISSFFIFLICLIVTAKFALVFFLYAHQFPVSPIQDPLEFRNLALNIFDGRFSSAQAGPYMPELYRTIGYPLFLSATFLFDKSGYLAIFLQQVMIGAVAFFLFLLVQKFLPQSKNLALFTALVFLLDPRIWFWSLETMSETLFLFLAVVSVFFLLRQDDPSWKHIGLSALFFGLALLTRPTGLLWLPGMLLLVALRNVIFETRPLSLFLRNMFNKQKIISALLFLLVALATVSPWVIRNYQLVGEPILSSSPALSYAYAFGGTDDKAEELTRSCAGKTVDAKGRQGCHIYGFTADAYAPLKTFVSYIKKDVPLSLFIEKNITGAFRVWTFTDYRDILSIGLKNVGLESNMQLSNVLYDVYGIFLKLIGLFGLLGIVFLYKEKRWDIAGAIVAILLFNTIITYNLAYGRHHIPLIPILLFSASFGMYFLSVLYRMVIRKINLAKEAASEKNSQNIDY